MWTKIPDWLIYLAIVLLIYGTAKQQSTKIDTPDSPPELGEMLPSETPRDKRIVVAVQSPRSGIGTAFAISDNGKWMTARHVVDSCDEVGIDVGGLKIIRVDAEVSPNSDTAILTSSWRRKSLAHDLSSQRQIGERGFFFGFPQGKPGDAVGTLLGRNRMVVRGRYRSDESILAWSEIGRSRGLRGSLGGLSGGPVLDKDGEVIGVVSAESPRRGRIYTVAPSNLKGKLSANTQSPTALTLQSYGLEADRLRRERRIAQVICLVN